MELALGLSSWVIQDGSYDDLRRGQRIDGAVEFVFREPPTLSLETPRIIRADGADHQIIGCVVDVTPEAWVLDAGDILVFNDPEPPPGGERRRRRERPRLGRGGSVLLLRTASLARSLYVSGVAY
jgi:hypothetical protein